MEIYIFFNTIFSNSHWQFFFFFFFLVHSVLSKMQKVRYTIFPQYFTSKNWDMSFSSIISLQKFEIRLFEFRYLEKKDSNVVLISPINTLVNGGMIENYTIFGMVRESPPYDFRIIFNAIICRTTPRIWFSIYFWPLDEIDGITAVFL